jgi:single-stranded DNA-binding protein
MYRTEIVANQFEFGAKPNGVAQGGGNFAPQNNTQSNQVQNSVENNNANEIEYPEEDINPEDIPF